MSLFLFYVDQENFSFEAGQYLNLGMPHDAKILFRSFSIASVNRTPATLNFVVPFGMDGLFSQYIYSLDPGEMIQALGPLGSMILDGVDSEGIFFYRNMNCSICFHVNGE